MAKGISESLSKDSTVVIKLAMSVLIGLAILNVFQTSNIVNYHNESVSYLNNSVTAFETGLAIFGSFVAVYIIWSIAKPIMSGFGK